MRYLIIGLGIYGSNLAKDLASTGHEVIGADIKSTIVEQIKDMITTAYILDSTDEVSLKALPIKSVDVVIVAIGENFGASVRTVAILKKLGAKSIYARAIDELHAAILEGFHVDKILRPEQEAAEDLVRKLALGSDVTSLAVDDETYVLEFKAPAFYNGIKYADLHLDRDFGLRMIAVTRGQEKSTMFGNNSVVQSLIDVNADADCAVSENDAWTVIGREKDFRRLYDHIS